MKLPTKKKSEYYGAHLHAIPTLAKGLYTLQIALLQTTTVKQKDAGGDGAAQSSPPLSTLAQVQRVVETQGWRGLFRGLEAALVGTTVSQGVYFTLYSLLRGAVTGSVPGATLTVAQSLAVASLAGAGNVLATNPFWVVATRMQMHRSVSHKSKVPDAEEKRKKEAGDEASNDHVEKPGNKSDALKVVDLGTSHKPPAIAVIREVLHEYGPMGFWNGCQASLVMVINPTLQYTLYEWLSGMRARVRATKGDANRRPSAVEIFVLSSLAKAGATVVTYPMLTVKNRMMTARRGDAHMQYNSIWDAVTKIWQAEGPGGYYRGLRPKLIQSVLAAALLFVAKEEIVQFTRLLLLRSPAKAKHHS